VGATHKIRKGETQMSIESAKAFLERVKTNEDFRNLVGGIATADQRMEFVRKSGYEFSKEEIDRVKDELGEDQLDGVVGGGYCPHDLSNCLIPVGGEDQQISPEDLEGAH
jgi:predicted ribosomally synthesized peptide with nif11-like leader